MVVLNTTDFLSVSTLHRCDVVMKDLILYQFLLWEGVVVLQ